MLDEHLSALIEKAWVAYCSNPEPCLVKVDPPLDMRALAAQLKILPVVLDMGGVMGLRANVEIVYFVWDEPGHLQIERDERIRNLVFFQAAKKFPELEALAPSRPTAARDCEFCHGTGAVLGLAIELSKDVLCFCGGLGWLPPNRS